MRYSIRKNWLETLEFMITKPVVIMPFAFIAFLELLALELLYFSTRFPLSYITNPIIRKFFGDLFTHYPGNLIILGRLFYYKQIVIYIFFGVFLTAVSINIFKNIKSSLPVTAKAMIKNSLNNYASFFVYGILFTALIFLLRKIDLFVFSKVLHRIAAYLPQVIPPIVYNVCIIMGLFLTNLIMQTLLMTTVPLIVIEKKRLFKAVAQSITLGIRNFFTIFMLIFLPFFIYLPITFLKSFSAEIADKTFPEINVIIMAVGIIASIFLDSFSILCVSKFLLDKNKQIAGKMA